MLLATKCPHCQTTFRVANDQLKLQAGLVRCGVCHQVFNGIEHLAGNNIAASVPVPVSVPASLPVAAPATAPAPVNQPISPPEDVAQLTDELEFDLPTPVALSTPERIEPTLDLPAATEPAPAPAAADPVTTPVSADDLIALRTHAEIEAEVQALLDSDLQAELAAKNDALLQVDALMAIESGEKQEETIVLASAFGEFDETYNTPRSSFDYTQIPAPESESTSDINPIDQLIFIRQAHARKRIVWAFSIATVLLLLLLIGQATYIFRDLLAATFPASKPTLTTLCQIAHCQIRLPSQIEALSYEADELHSLPHENTFEFGLLLHNRSTLVQSWPQIELTLKNTHKQPVLRRVFSPADYLANPAEIATGFAPGQEQSVKMYFEVSQIKASDYVVAIFYP